MKVSLRIWRKGKAYYVQRKFFGIWFTLETCYTEFAAKRELESWVRGIKKDAEDRVTNKIQGVVEVVDVEL